ncbi:MAG: hypothetical protein ACLTSX_06325 [Collinsella sp.]
MLYFSNTSELGHVYTRAEFDALCDCGRKATSLAVYVDGARMASTRRVRGRRPHRWTISPRAPTRSRSAARRPGMLFGEALVVSPALASADGAPSTASPISPSAADT